MSVIVCPGMHSPQFTASFLQTFPTSHQWLVFPAHQYPAYSALALFQFLQENLSNPSTASPLLFICFSAGVVGGIGAAMVWQMNRGKVKALIAIDGWGVPLLGDFPIHRFSHDYFTHWSSALLGAGEDSFYADPGVEHLDMWRSPQTSLGWWQTVSGIRENCSAVDALRKILAMYEKL